MVDGYAEAVRELGDRLGTTFFQIYENLAAKNLPRAIAFIEASPKDVRRNKMEGYC